MIPKNSKDRRKAFYIFLVFLLASIAIIITTVYFSTEMPFRQVKQLKQQVSAYDSDRDFSQKFTNAMLGVKANLDTVDKIPASRAFDEQISGGIDDLYKMIRTDSVQNKQLYNTVTSILTSLQQTKLEKRNLLKKSDNSTEEINSEIATLRRQKESAVGDNAQIQKLVDEWANRLHPDFVEAIRKYKSVQ